MLHLVPRFIKEPFYALARRLVNCRLSSFPLTLPQAEAWADTIKKYPVIFGSESFPRLCTLLHGIQMRLGVTDHIERHLRIEKQWDRPVSAVLEAVLKPGATFLDIGANIGYFSLLASRMVQDSGRVISIEPSHRALRKFTENMHRNRCGNVTLLSVGAGDSFQNLRLTLANEGNIGGSSIMADPGRQPTESIAVIPLAALLGPLQVRPDLIKMDIEGFELFALKGLFSEVDWQCPVVCEVTAEFLQRNGQSVRELLSFMQSHGYQAHRLIETSGTIYCKRLQVNTDYEASPQFDAIFVHSTQQSPLPAED